MLRNWDFIIRSCSQLYGNSHFVKRNKFFGKSMLSVPKKRVYIKIGASLSRHGMSRDETF